MTHRVLHIYVRTYIREDIQDRRFVPLFDSLLEQLFGLGEQSSAAPNRGRSHLERASSL
jgi:hypothetical protein